MFPGLVCNMWFMLKCFLLFFFSFSFSSSSVTLQRSVFSYAPLAVLILLSNNPQRDMVMKICTDLLKLQSKMLHRFLAASFIERIRREEFF